MTDGERLRDWVRYYQAAHLKMNAIQAVAQNDPKLLEKFLDEIGLASRLDVIKACAGDWPYTDRQVPGVRDNSPREIP